MMKSMILKDFTYIDFERVRSYLAQMNGKLSEQVVEESQHSSSATAGAGAGGVSKLLIDVEATGSYMYTRSTSETSSLHHAIYDAFEEQTARNGWVGSIMDSKPFAKVSCRIKVVDYQLLAEQFKATADVMPLLSQMTDQSAQKKHSQSEKQSEKQQVKQIKELARTIELLFGEVRVMQMISDDGELIAQAFLNDELLPQKSVFLAQNNQILPEEWTVLCLKPLEQRKIPTPVYSGDDFSDKLQNASESLATIKSLIMPDKGAPTVVPIAIYRKLS